MNIPAIAGYILGGAVCIGAAFEAGRMIVLILGKALGLL